MFTDGQIGVERKQRSWRKTDVRGSGKQKLARERTDGQWRNWGEVRNWGRQREENMTKDLNQIKESDTISSHARHKTYALFGPGAQ